MGRPMREVRFEVEGETVVGTLHEPTGAARGQIVLVHGFLSRSGEFGEVPARLAGMGWRVLGADQRGFGASSGPRGIITEARALADVLAAVGWMRKDRPDLPVGLVGHSMGSVFTTGALAADPAIGAAVLGAPMRTVRSELGGLEFLGYRAAAAASRAKERLGLGPLRVPYKNRYRDLFHDEEAMRRAEKAGFLDSHVSLANYDALVGMDAERNARRVRQPVLVIVAELDRAVKAANSLAVYEALAGPKEKVTLRCGHSLFGDCEAEAATAHVDRWMRQHLRAPG